MRKAARTLSILIAAATLSSYATAYVGGRCGMPLSVIGLPAQIGPILLSILCLIALFITMLCALIKQRDRSGVLLYAGLGFAFFILAFAIMPMKIFQMGFRTRITSRITPQELRDIATIVQTSLPEDGRLRSPMRADDHQEQWDALAQKTAVEKLGPRMVIFRHRRSVEISWGGALMGHWGVIIDTAQAQGHGDIAPGIRTYVAH